VEDFVQRERFVASRKQRWEQFEALLKRAGRSNLRKLTGDEVFLFGQLYRITTSDLAIAQRDFPHDRVTVYLNGLVGRAHPLIYQTRGVGMRRIGVFVRYGFPASWRSVAPYTLLAFLIFLTSGFIAAGLVLWRASMADALLPGEAQQLRSVLEQHHLWVKSATENHSVAADFIITNNLTVAFSAFALGVFAGLGTVWVMIQNGINIGAVGAMVWQYKLSRPFWAFVLPHGVIELSVIFMAGGAGMLLGDTILRPGTRRRQDAIPDAARRAAVIVLGCVPLLIICGTIEGFFSPSGAPDGLKFAVGALTFVLLYGYLIFSRPTLDATVYTFSDVVQQRGTRGSRVAPPLEAGISPRST
jgi:uncharacterized membrane protein SpoIIM required for sporulation